MAGTGTEMDFYKGDRDVYYGKVKCSRCGKNITGRYDAMQGALYLPFPRVELVHAQIQIREVAIRMLLDHIVSSECVMVTTTKSADKEG